MKRFLLLLLMTFLSVVFSVQATGTLPQGKWTIEKVTIEKNTDGNVKTTVYNTAAEVKSHIPCPQELEINAQSIVLRFTDEWEEIAEYSIEDVSNIYASTGWIYRYDTKGENLILTATYNYVNNDLEAKRTESITEKWTITLKNEQR